MKTQEELEMEFDLRTTEIEEQHETTRTIAKYVTAVSLVAIGVAGMYHNVDHCGWLVFIGVLCLL